jgi:hypothetical protein
MMTIEGHTVIGHQTLIRSGCYSKERYWLAGWISNLKTGHCDFVYGITRKETMVTFDVIKPIVVFDVRSN